MDADIKKWPYILLSICNSTEDGQRLQVCHSSLSVTADIGTGLVVDMGHATGDSQEIKCWRSLPLLILYNALLTFVIPIVPLGIAVTACCPQLDPL